MGTEYERKFLTRDEAWRKHVLQSTHIEQHYLAGTAQLSVRMRITPTDCTLTVKSTDSGAERFELELPIQHHDAIALAARSIAMLTKTRHLLDLSPGVWTVDEYGLDQHNLDLLEVETPGPIELPIPDWVGQEVTHDDAYRNEHLAIRRGSSDAS